MLFATGGGDAFAAGFGTATVAGASAGELALGAAMLGTADGSVKGFGGACFGSAATAFGWAGIGMQLAASWASVAGIVSAGESCTVPYPLAGETSTSLLLLGDVNNLVGSGEASTSTDSLLCPRTIVFWLSKSSTLGDMWPCPNPGTKCPA